MKNRPFRSISLALATFAVLSTAQADSPTTIKTPKGTSVAATNITIELSAAEITSLNNYVATSFPLATRETNASRKYNCHSYAWHTQSTANTIWLNTPGDDAYWIDKSYRLHSTVNGQVAIPANVPNLAKVSYSNNDHSAIKVSTTKYRSKWGQAGRMLHKPGYSPYSCADQQCSFTIKYYIP